MTDQPAEHGPCTRTHGTASTQLDHVQHCRCPDADDCKVWPAARSWPPVTRADLEQVADALGITDERVRRFAERCRANRSVHALPPTTDTPERQA